MKGINFSDLLKSKNGLPLTLLSAFFVVLGFIGYAANAFSLPLTVILIAVGFVLFFCALGATRKELETKQKEQEEQTRQAERNERIQQMNERVSRKQKEFAAVLDQLPRFLVKTDGALVRHRSPRNLEWKYWNVTRTTRLSGVAPFCVIDVETTGLNPASDRIIEIAAIKFDEAFRPAYLFHTFINPEMPIPAESYAIHKISDETVEDAPKIYEILPSLSTFISGCHLVAHNADFDFSFLYAAGLDIPSDVRLYDTLQLARNTIPKSEIDNYKLGTLANHYGIYPTDAHRSTEDALTVGTVFTALVADRTDLAPEDVTSQGAAK